jgi:hypothetical protein
MCHSAGQSFRHHIGQVVVMVGDMSCDGEPHRRNVGARRDVAHGPAPSAGRVIVTLFSVGLSTDRAYGTVSPSWGVRNRQ